MLVVIVAGGEVPEAGAAVRHALFAAADLVVAADSGLVCCVQHGVWPQVLVGDLDSVPEALVDDARGHGVEVLRHPVDKDATDLELAFELATSRGGTEIQVMAPFGSRIDHELANVALLAVPRWSPLAVSGHDGLRSLWVVWASVELAEAPGTTVSLLPWGGDVTGVVTDGLSWPLDTETLHRGTTRGVSNVCEAARQSVRVEQGPLLVVVDRSNR